MAKAGKGITLKRSQLVSMFVALGIDVAPKWTVSRLQEKTVALNSIVDEDTKVPAEHQETFDAVLKLIEKKIALVIEDDGDGQSTDEAPKSKKDKPAAKSKKAKEEEVEDDDSEDDEDEDEDDDSEDEEEEAPKSKKDKSGAKSKKAKKEEVESEDEDEEEAPKSKKEKGATKSKSKKEEKDVDDDSEIEDGPAPKSARKKVPKTIDPKTPKKGPGVIAVIVSLLRDDFISKEDILAKLCKEFPDREESAMKQTVNTQIPSRLKQTYCLQKSNGKFKIVDGKAGLVEVEGKSAKSKKSKKEEVDDEEDEVEEAPKKKKSKK
jgi:hypothetical protein